MFCNACQTFAWSDFDYTSLFLTKACSSNRCRFSVPQHQYPLDYCTNSVKGGRFVSSICPWWHLLWLCWTWTHPGCSLDSLSWQCFPLSIRCNKCCNQRTWSLYITQSRMMVFSRRTRPSVQPGPHSAEWIWLLVVKSQLIHPHVFPSSLFFSTVPFCSLLSIPIMLSAKPLRLRRCENIHIITFIGLTILLWKICVESIPWPHLRSFFSNADLSASNATLGVRCQFPVLSTPNWTLNSLKRSSLLLQTKALAEKQFGDKRVYNEQQILRGYKYRFHHSQTSPTSKS